MLRKLLTYVSIMTVLSGIFILPVSAAAAYESYTRVDVPGNVTELSLSREMYTAVCEINADTLGLEEALNGITDIFSNDRGKIFLLCGEESRLVRINSDYTFDKEIKVSDADGNLIDFKGAKGVFCDSDDLIYIADTLNSRILVVTQEGLVTKILDPPNEELIPEDFVYQPIAVSKDQQGYTYILSIGCYYGALMYSPEYEFMGFYGSNTVESSALDTLSYLWEKLTSNDTKKAASIKKLPYSFSDFCFDNEGYMLTSTGSVSNTAYSQKSIGQIKKISHNGANILYKRNLDGTTVSSNAVDFLETQRAERASVQDIVSIDVSEDNYIFALDGTNGYIYIYDSVCNLMSAFGGGYTEGNRLGVFINPTAITLNGNHILVADEGSLSITVFKPTDYGMLLRKAQSLYLKGDYEESKIMWQEVLSKDRNCQLAYKGIAMAYYGEGDFDAALEAAEIAVDYSVYNLAWAEILKETIAENFLWVLIVFVLLIIIVIAGCLYLKRKNIKLVKNEKLKLFLNVPFHPFDSFENLKYKKQGSLKIAIGMTFLLYIGSVLNEISSGFLYTTSLLRNYNAIYTLFGTVGVLLLWSVCNWLVCSMFDGKGRFKDVYISSTYALAPYILFLFVKTLATNFMPLEGAGLINAIETAVLIFTFFLLCIAMMKVHEYDFFKFIFTGIAIIFFIILVIFVIFMCAILIKQCLSFISTVYEEVAYR